MNPLLSVQPEYFSQLASAEAVNAFRMLLNTEAHRLKIPKALINAPLAENTPDGGIDASVNAPADLSEGDLIQGGLNCYQIKSGKNFKPWQKSKLEKELFNSQKASLENLSPGIRDCLEKNGRYVFVCFGHDLTDQQCKDANKHLTELFEKCGFNHSKHLILSQNQLISISERHPSIVRKFMGHEGEPFIDYEEWSKHADMQQKLTPSDGQSKYIKQIRENLKNLDRHHIRIWGEPGIGKTRLLFEALGDEQLAPQVIYTDQAEAFLESAVFRNIRLNDSIQAIVVLDDCDPDTLSRFLNRSTSAADRIQSISVFQENDAPSGVVQIEAPSLSEDEIIDVIKQHYSRSESELRRWAKLCGGSPRVAHAIGENLAENPDDPLKPTSMDNLWDRYIQGPRQTSPTRYEKTRQVLRHIALFKRFGFAQPLEKEAEVILSLVRDRHRSIGRGDFQEIVKDLRDRRILQGERTLYITPKALHIWLWADWFDTYGSDFNLDKFLDKLAGSLSEWFHEMFRYAEASDTAKRCIARMVGPNGPFRNRDVICSESGSRFLRSMTEANPEACLQCLEATIGKWSIEDLKKFIEGRQNIVFALEKIVVWEDLFQRGAKLLLKLAEAENEFYYSNNASGIFVDLFSPGYGDVSPTVAPPEVRFPILQEAAESNSQAQRMLGLKACSKALETLHLSRMAGAEFQGLREKPDLWKPKTWGDFWLQYERTLRYLIEQISKLDGTERDFAAQIVLNRARGLFNTPPPLPDLCTNALKDFLADGILSETRVLEVLEDTLEYDGEGLDSSVKTKLKSMRDALIGSSLSGRLSRFIKLDRPSDNLDSEKREKVFKELACQSLQNPQKLLSEYSWLVTQEAKNGHPFGYWLGVADNKCSLLKSIASAQAEASEKDASLAFLGGYLRALFERDYEEWENLLDDWASHEIYQKWIPEITWRNDLTDRAAHRIFSLIQAGLVPWTILGLFRYGQIIKQLSENTVIDWLNILSSLKEPDAAHIAVELLYAYYERTDEKHPIPLEIGKQILQNSELIGLPINHNDILGYEWIDINIAFADQYPDESPEILNFLIQDIAAQGKLTERHDEACYKLARLLISSRPIQCWKMLEPELNSNDHIRSYLVQQWLSGGILDDESHGVWPVIPLEELWRWIDEDVEERASIIASIAPKSIEIKGAGLVTRELLIRYGERDDVRGRLMLNFFSGAGWGPASNRYRKIQEQLRKLRSQHEEPVIRNWIDETISSLDQMIERAETEEERRDW
ncbi:MAG: hypothetical protein ISN29_10460 [Gammaproteobacteria bacterium AqS3]|nr:hypothetical protein [Gammaproteobacteria bacterium AqS3]